MGTFKEDYNKRLRRVCGVTDDSLTVTEDSETISGGYCETCYYEEEVIVVRVTDEDGKIVGKETFYDLGELMRALDEVEEL